MTNDPWGREFTRRSLIQRSAGLALGASAVGGLAACGVGSQKTSTTATEKVVKAQVDGDLVYFNYSEYVDPGVVKRFEKHYGVKVTQAYYDSMAGMMSKLNAGNVYDVIFPSAEYVDRLRKANRLLKIDHSQLKNAEQALGFSPYFANPWYDPNANHSMPYTMYTTGIGWRADKVGDKLTGSWHDLWNEKAKGKIFVLDDYQEAVGMGNLVNGFDLNTTDSAQLDKTKQLLVAQKPLLRGYSTDTITNMSNGSAWIHHIWNGDIVNVRNQVKNPEDYKFETAKEGTPIGSDTFVIPTNAAHPGTALLFIDWMLDPANAAKNIEYIGYPMPNKGGYSAFEGLVKEEPSINVTVEQLQAANQFQFRDLDQTGLQRWNDTWTAVKAA
jgi:spermidine/putrescine transport system substrate-binding protein